MAFDGEYEDLPVGFWNASLKISRISTTNLRDFTICHLPDNKRFVHVLKQIA